MTRLSDALKRAAEEETSVQRSASAPAQPEELRRIEPPSAWQFAPEETMHVPEAPGRSAVAANESRGEGGPPAPPEEGYAPAPARPEELRRIEMPSPTGAAVAASGREGGSLRFGDADRDKLIVGAKVDPAMVEQYRHLAAVLHHAQKASGVRSVMVTSALPSEGKTLTATNLALTLSQSYQRRVLLIDADLRRPRMREMFALPSSVGLTDSLTMPRGDRLPVQQITPTLWVLTSGRAAPDPMSQLVSPAMKQLLEEARDSFDWVVVDTPPIAILPDANLLAAMIDTALLVVSAQSTPYPMVQRAAQAIGAKRILGVVLNRAERATLPANYGYYGYTQARPGHPRAASQRRWLGWIRKSGGVPSASA